MVVLPLLSKVRLVGAVGGQFVLAVGGVGDGRAVGGDAGLVADGVEGPALGCGGAGDGVEDAAVVARCAERAAGEGGQAIERVVGGAVVAACRAVGVVKLGEGAVDQVVLVEDVAVLVVVVLEAVRGGGVGVAVFTQFWSITRPKRSRPVTRRRHIGCRW